MTENRPIVVRLALADVGGVVAESFGLTFSDLCGSRQTKTVALARHVAWWVARRVTGASFPELGRAFGGRTHATVMSGIARVEALLAQEPNEWSPRLLALVGDVERIAKHRRSERLRG